MARLTREYAALRRAFQVSHARVVVLVEGREVDAYLYDKICLTVLTPNGTSYRIVRADEIVQMGNSGGKEVLLGFFDYLKRTSALHVAGCYTTLFCLDKDVDDLERRMRRSPHVLYTTMYDIENLLVGSADLKDCAAAALSVPVATCSHLSPANAWCLAVQSSWASWVTLRLCAKSFQVQRANYSSLSQVNVPLHGPVSQPLVVQIIRDIAAKAAVPQQVAMRRYAARFRWVNDLIKQGHGDRVFKGKWYLDILASELAAMRRGRNVGGLRSSLQALLMQSANVAGPQFEFIRTALTTRAAAV